MNSGRKINLISQFSPLELVQSVGHATAVLTSQLLENDLVDRPVVVLVGNGHKAAVGLAAAQLLHQAGAWLQTVCVQSMESSDAVQTTLLNQLLDAGAPLAWAEEGWELPPCDLLIDAIVGCELTHHPQGKVRELILLANSSNAEILSIEVPSGTDCRSGNCFFPHIVAKATIVLGVAHPNLFIQPARGACGELYVAKAGISADAYLTHYGMSTPAFDKDGLAKL